jgi:hypothetical protein
MVRRGRHLRHLPLVAEAFSEGVINAAHLDTLVAVRRPDSEETMARDEAMLVKQAKRLRFDQFTRAVAYWDQLADPDGSEEAAEERRARRDVYLEPSLNGMFLGSMTLDPISGSIVSGELSMIEEDFFKADWARARAERGGNPTPDDLWRTPAQRRADALVEMAVRAAAAPPDGRRPEPLFTVLVGWETLHGRICQLADGTVIAPGALVPWLDQTWLERVVFDADSRVVDVGAARRLFTGATRRAVEVRDQECYHQYCDEPYDHCQIDHIIPHAAGGATTQDNGRLACGYHNRARHQPPPSPSPPDTG